MTETQKTTNRIINICILLHAAIILLCACADMAASKFSYSKLELIYIKYNVDKYTKYMNLSYISASVQKTKPKKTHRGCRSGENVKIRKANKKWTLLLWNIEGYKSVVKESPENNLFLNYELIFLNETFLCEQLKIQNYITYTSEAVKTNTKGRPSGGILAGFKPELQPILIDKNQNYIIVKTKIACFANFYFSPLMDFEDISDLIDSALNKIDKNNTIYLLGDFNCRIDNNSEKGANLTEHMANEHFKLLNNKCFTYISPNGNSTIDLIFTNAPRFATKVKIIPTVVRKHQKIEIGIYATQITPVMIQKKSSRKLDQQLLINNCAVSKIEIKAFNANINILNDEITRVIKTSKIEPKNHYHKRWFDQECRALKKKCIEKLKAQESDYKDVRREYKTLIKNKRITYEENHLIENFNKNEIQWQLFRPKRPIKQGNISTNRLFNHYNNLYSHPVLSLKSNTNNYELWCDELFSEEEIHQSIMQTKNNKASGTDGITYELIKQSLPHMQIEWLMIFNRCLIEAEIPQKWRESKICSLYKGKGEVDDPNSYRGIALQQSMFKCLTKLINNRIITNVLHSIPKEQFGFLPQKSTIQAIHIFISDINSALKEDKTSLYACFVDFEKAFDNVDRNLLNQKLIEDFNMGGRLLNLIITILIENWIYIHNNEEKSKRILQRKGLAQGDSLSPTLFILYIHDLPKAIKGDLEDLEVTMYADDLRISSKKKENINIALTNLSKYCAKNNLIVNLHKTQIIKFRKGGKLAKSDVFKYNNKIVEIVNKYNYLGMILTTKLSFTEHIKHRKLQAIKAINCLPNLTRLSIETAEELFERKIKPIVTYGFSAFVDHITTNQLNELDKVKFRYIKRILGVSKLASSTVSLHIIGWCTLGDDLIRDYNIRNSVVKEYREHRENKNWEFVSENYTDGPAFTGSCWRKANQTNRSLICRLTVHGLHHLICVNDKFHEFSYQCKCKFCDKPCDNRYHILNCDKTPKHIIQ